MPTVEKYSQEHIVSKKNGFPWVFLKLRSFHTEQNSSQQSGKIIIECSLKRSKKKCVYHTPCERQLIRTKKSVIAFTELYFILQIVCLLCVCVFDRGPLWLVKKSFRWLNARNWSTFFWLRSMPFCTINRMMDYKLIFHWDFLWANEQQQQKEKLLLYISTNFISYAHHTRAHTRIIHMNKRGSGNTTKNSTFDK